MFNDYLPLVSYNIANGRGCHSLEFVLLMMMVRVERCQGGGPVTGTVDDKRAIVIGASVWRML